MYSHSCRSNGRLYIGRYCVDWCSFVYKYSYRFNYKTSIENIVVHTIVCYFWGKWYFFFLYAADDPHPTVFGNFVLENRRENEIHDTRRLLLLAPNCEISSRGRLKSMKWTVAQGRDKRTGIRPFKCLKCSNSRWKVMMNLAPNKCHSVKILFRIHFWKENFFKL